MSDSLATAASYAEDFHDSSSTDANGPEDRRSSSHSSQSPRQRSITDAYSDTSVDELQKRVASYRYSDRHRRRLICIYAPEIELQDGEEDGDWMMMDNGEARCENPQQAGQLTARSRRSGVNDGIAVSYSSSFEATATSGTGGTRQAQTGRSRRMTATSDSSSSSSSSRSSSPASSSNGLKSTMSKLRIISIEELTQAHAEGQAEHRFLNDAHERLVRTARSESSESTSPAPTQRVEFVESTDYMHSRVSSVAIEATAGRLLAQLRSKKSLALQAPQQDASTAARYSHYFPIASVDAAEAQVPRLAVEQLRIDSLRRASRLLTSGVVHDTTGCPECLQLRNRLEEAENVRRLASRVRRNTTEQRLQQHQPASVMSREMLNVARVARLVSESMRSGKAPPFRCLS